MDKSPRVKNALYQENHNMPRMDMRSNEQNNQYDHNKDSIGTSNPGQPAVHASGYTMIHPNETRRNKLLTIAQKEEEDQRRWKEKNRPGPIYLTPEKLGGSVSMAEVRWAQQQETRSSSLRKKLQKDEMDKKKRQEKEEEYDKMKAIQREKANKLEMRRRHDEQQRRAQHWHDHQMKSEAFFQKMERSSKTNSKTTGKSAAATSTETLGKQEDPETHKQQEEKRWTEMDRRRVNSAFLDRLQKKSTGGNFEPAIHSTEKNNICLDDDKAKGSASPTLFDHSQVQPDSVEEDDYNLTLAALKLHHKFPFYEREILEDILTECNGNYEQAVQLLNH